MRPTALTAPPASRFLIAQYGASGNRSFAFFHTTNNTLQFNWSNTGFSETADIILTYTTLTVNAWNALALTYDGTNLRGYRNGTRVSQTNRAITLFNSSAPLSIAGQSNGANSWPGSIDEVRITRGIARYTGASYTVDTTAFPRF